MKLSPLAHAVAAATAALVAVCVALAAHAAPAPAATLPESSTALLSGGPSLFQALDVPVYHADITTKAVSEDGHYVAFSSHSDGLLAGDDDRILNVYRKDMATGEVALVSRAAGLGGEPSHGNCYDAAISDDGQRVGFTCDGSLDPADANDRSDVYVREPATGGTILVSRRSATGPAASGDSSEPALSQDGDYVAFTSNAPDVISGGTTDPRNVYRRHLSTQTTELVSRRDGVMGKPSAGIQPSITDDGKLVAFATADDSDPADTITYYDIYVRDMSAYTTTLASRASGTAGAVGDGHSLNPSISGNGLAVVFTSSAANFDARDDDQGENVYRRSLGLHLTAVLDAGLAGTTSGRSWEASSDDSSHVIAFVSDATGLDPADTDPSPDVYVRNVLANTVKVVSREDGAGGAVANRDAGRAAMSGDAFHVAGALFEGGITPGSDPRMQSVFLRGVASDTTRAVARPAGTDPFVNAGGDAEDVRLSADGRFAAFVTNATGLGVRPGTETAVVVRDRVTGAVTLVSRADGPDGEPFESSSDPAISADGRRVAFTGVPRGSDVRQVWVRDLETGQTILASRADGAQGAPGDDRSRGAALDADGTRVVFRSRAKNLGDGDTDDLDDVHVRDLVENRTLLASRADGPDGAKGDDDSSGPDIDASGTLVSFGSYAKNLGDGDTDTTRDAHLRDLAAGTTRLVSATPAGVKSDGNLIGDTSIDAAGRRVAFAAPATTLGEPTTDPKAFVRDLAQNTLDIVGKGFDPILTADGGHVAYLGDQRGVILHDLARGESAVVSRHGGAAGPVVAGPSTLYDVSTEGGCVAFGTGEPIVGPARDTFDAYLRAVKADCGDVAPAGGGGDGAGDGEGPAGGPGAGGDRDGASRDDVAPVLTDVRLVRRRFGSRRGTVVRFRSSEAGTLTLTVERVRRGAGGRAARRVGAVERSVAAGEGRVALKRLGRRRLRAGRHRLVVAVRDAAGNRSRDVRRRFVVVRAGRS